MTEAKKDTILYRNETEYWVEYKVKLSRKIIHKGKLEFQENFGSILSDNIEKKVREAIDEHPEFDGLSCKDMMFLSNDMGVDFFFSRIDLSFFKEGNEVEMPFVLDDGKTKLRFKFIFTAKPKVVKKKFMAFTS